MKRISLLTLAVCLLAAPGAFADLEGSWTASMYDKHPDQLHLSLNYGTYNQNGMSVKIDALNGLTTEQINAATMTPVQFRIDREAGVATFDGTFRNRHGAGEFSFKGNPSYPAEVAKLGVKFDLKRRRHQDQEEQLFTLALFDVSTAFIRSMQAEGYNETLDTYLSMRIFDITPQYIREMRSLGYKNIDADDLVATRIHRVTPDYIREMRAIGWNLSLEEFQSSRIFNVTPEFAQEMKRLGFANLSHEDLVAFRIHKVTPEFIAEMRQLGYKNLDGDDLVWMRIHGVTPAFIRELADAGYHNVPVEKLVAMKIHRIDVKMIKAMNDVN
jgi:hypothetical protein